MKVKRQEDFQTQGSVVYQSKDYFKVFTLFEKEIVNRNDKLKKDIHYYQMDDIEMIHMDKEVQGLNSITVNKGKIIKKDIQKNNEIKEYDEQVLIKEIKNDLKWYMKKLENIEDGQLYLYFHCAMQGKKLDLIRKNNRATFEMDCDHNFILYDERMSCTMGYSSVVGHGIIEFVEEEKSMKH